MIRSLLLLCLAASQVTAAPVQVEIQVAAATAADPVAAILRATPQPAEQAENKREIRMTVPGWRTLDLAPGVWRIQAEAAGYWSEEQVVSVAQGKESTVQVRLFPTGNLRGRIEPPRGRKAPERLEVRFSPAPAGAPRGAKPEDQGPKGTLSCPIRGEVWECTVPAGITDLRLHAQAMVPIYRWGVHVEAGRSVDLGVLALRPGASVIGRVITETGAPAGSVRVELAPELLGTIDNPSTGQRLQALSLETRTDDRGFFQFRGVAPGTYATTASSPGMAPARVSPVHVREGLEAEMIDPLVLARPVTLAVDLSPPLDPYGSPWSVQLFKEVNPGGGSTLAGKGQADREGRWLQKGLAPGRYRIAVLGDLESRWAHQVIEVFPGDVPVPLEIPVVEIRGRLTLGDSPLAGTLWFGGKSGARRIRFDADEEGEFAGFLPEEGIWPVQLVNESEGLLLALEPVEVRVPRGKRVADIEIQVPDTTLEGEVVDESGRPLPGALIHLTGARKSSEAVTGDEGKFRIRGISPGSVVVEAEEGDRSTGPVLATIHEESESPWLRLVLRSSLEVQGRVVSAAGPVPGAEVMAWPAMGQVAFATSQYAVSGPDGGFSLHFPSQTRALTLFVFAPGHAFRMTQVPVEPGRPLEIPVQDTGGTLVLDLPRGSESGPPPSPLLVHGGSFTPLLVLTRWVQMQRAEQTDPGRLVVPNMEIGDYSLCLGAGAELRQGKEPPAARCASGTLLPNGELRLAVPASGS